MRSRVGTGVLGRIARATFVAGLAAGGICPTQSEALAEDSPAVVAAREEVEKLRREMELAYLDVKRDHENVRAADWSRTPFGDEFTSALGELVRDARARTEERSAQQDLDDSSAAVSALAGRRIAAPLTRTSMIVVLAETVRSARADRKPTARELFTASAATVFAAAKTEDVWDTSFVALPVVQAYRAAQSKLAAAQAAPVPVPAPATDGAPPPNPPEKPAEKLADPLGEMVLCERARPWLGPWTGWTSDLSEKQNRRAQRSVKPVWIDRFEVTCAEYGAFLDHLGPMSRRAMVPQGWTLGDDDKVGAPAGKERHPVTGVTWRQAQAYAEALGKRLPTVDEWERAATGGDKEPRAFPWGGTDEGKRWSHLGVEPKGTFPVDAFPDDATPDGIGGLAGNAAELVSTYPDRADVPKSGPEKGKQVLVCGGSFASRASECETSWRWVVDSDAASPSVGFRCAMDEAEYRKRRK